MRTWILSLLVACGTSAPPPAAPAPEVGHVAAQATLATAAEDVELVVGERRVPATIVAPTTKGPWPALVLLAGSGPTDRDWNSPLLATRNGSGKLLAEELARHGLVVIRFDKAGSGNNRGPADYTTWTVDTYRDEAAAALAALRARPDVRGDRVFVAGHSEGGIHATRLAALPEARLRGVLYLASASRTMADTMLSQVEAQLRGPLAGLTEVQVVAEMTALRAAFADFAAGKPVDATKASTLPPLQQLMAAVTAPATARLASKLVTFDNAREAAQLPAGVPMLVTSGGKDIQIDPTLDGKHLADAVRASGHEVAYHVAPDADHVLKHEPKSVAELRAHLDETQTAYNADGRTLDPELVTTIVAWLAAHE